MKTQIKQYLLFTLLFLFSASVYSQNSNDISKLTLGKTYKIILFDDTEITGKLIGIDSVNVRVETENKNIIIIPKNNILYYSTELEPSKYNACVTLMGGISVPTNESYTYYNNESHPGPNFNAALLLFLSDTKAVKIDAGYTYIKRNNDNYYYPYPVTDPAHQSTFTGGDNSLYSLKFNMLFGKFSPDERFMYYASLGIGVHLTHTGDYTETYWLQNYPDTSKWTYHVSNVTYPIEANLVLGIGASLGYRVSKNFGIKAEVEYNLVTAANYFLFFGGRSYFPMRAGVFYVF